MAIDFIKAQLDFLFESFGNRIQRDIPTKERAIHDYRRYIFQEWRDERIGWNANDYNGLEVVRLPAKLFWLPDLVLYNKLVEYLISLFSRTQLLLSTMNRKMSPDC